MSNDRFAAIVLAAGYSSRMGRFKPLLPIGGKSVIERAIEVFKDIGAENIYVVTGYRAPEIHEMLQSSGVRLVDNPNYADGMFSSVQAGIRCLEANSPDAFFITPADICLIRPITIQLLLTAYSKHPGKIIHPIFCSQRGHPPLIPASLIPVILKSRGNGGLKTILKKFDNSAMDIQVPDRYMRMDMDHMEAYENAVLRLRNHDVPTEEECEVILQHVCKVPEKIVLHCRKVARIAGQICRILQNAGVALDLDLVTAGALVHDVAKGEKDHAGAGARMLDEMGFPKVARIVSEHTDLKDISQTEITESEIVYMADKLVIKTRITTLEERFEQALKRFGHEPEAKKMIKKRKENTLMLKRKIERFAGMSMDSIIVSPLDSDQKIRG